ncbi:MAG: VTT domain-containing protein [Bryobacteraceae bacterium]|nr:VTT domain-containing protein [Bryobacteraceae bacterium]MDW8377562.1 VTT domain-containing protein [Bryobacterales bacterium]
MSRKGAWFWYFASIFSLILIPFALWDSQMAEQARQLLAKPSKTEVAAAVVILLAADVFLPVPSSMVSLAAGVVLGWQAGWCAVWLGMTLGSVAGYSAGRFGSRFLRLALTDEEILRRSLGWAIVLSRPAPIVAEAVSLTAGFLRAPVKAFLVWSMLANAAVAAIYAIAGAFARSASSWLAAFVLAIAIPGAARWIYQRKRAFSLTR